MALAHSAAAIWFTLTLLACPMPPITTQDLEKTHQMNGQTSPDGQTHPGSIRFIDELDGRDWTEHAEANPQSIAWVHDGQAWVAVVRVEMGGSPERRRVSSFGADGQLLESTVEAPPPPSHADPVPVPEPTEAP